jgi:acyl-CoA reductase-like NAD-dependent aldehyde dehydrogenase
VNIPDEAVKAAAKSFMIGAWGRYDPEEVPRILNAVRESLVAAAPHLMAQAWDEGYVAGEDHGEWEAAPVREEPSHANPYKQAASG